MNVARRGIARRALTGIASLVMAALAPLPGAALASDGYELTGLHVYEGDGWHSYNSFAIEWDPNPPGTATVYWRLRNANQEVIPGYGLEETTDPLVAGLHVPPVPGVYLFEVWNKSNLFGVGPFGPATLVPLRFDDARPGAPGLSAPGLVAAGQAVPVRIAPPPAPLPVSGIAGYAVTIDSQEDGAPCAHRDRCTAAEIVPASGGVQAIGLSSRPEGISYVHAVAVTNAGVDSGEVATAKVVIDGTPPAVRLEGVPQGWVAEPVRVTVLAVDPVAGMAPAGPSGPITALSVDRGRPLIEPGGRVSATVGGQGVHQLDFYGRDALGNSGDGSLPFAGPGSATIRIDETDPVVRFAAPDPTDPERIEAGVADPLSGPDPDRGSIALRRVGSSGSFRPLPTDTRRGHLVARWDSDDFPRGSYEFRATGFDLAGNSKTTNLGAQGDAFVLQNPVKRETHLAFGFGAGRLIFQRCSRVDGGRRCHRAEVRSFARRPAARTVPCCHGALVGGLLVDAVGAPLAGQTVEVIEAFAAGSHNAERRTTLTTDRGGRFSTRLAPGPSRTVGAEFPGTGRLTRADGRRIRLRVRAAVRLRVSTGHADVGGRPVVFRGRIAHPEAPIPATGLPVQLQFRLPGMPWTEFRTVQSDAYGGFRYPYTFSDDDSAGVRFQFRAAVPATGDWPFAPATSRPVAVTG